MRGPARALHVVGAWLLAARAASSQAAGSWSGGEPASPPPPHSLAASARECPAASCHDAYALGDVFNAGQYYVHNDESMFAGCKPPHETRLD